MSKCNYTRVESVKCTNMERHNSCHHDSPLPYNQNFTPDVIFNFPYNEEKIRLTRKQKLQIRIDGNDPIEREKALQSLTKMRAKKTRQRKARRNANKII